MPRVSILVELAPERSARPRDRLALGVGLDVQRAVSGGQNVRRIGSPSSGGPRSVVLVKASYRLAR